MKPEIAATFESEESASGALIANNLICVAGKAVGVARLNGKPSKIIFDNNLVFENKAPAASFNTLTSNRAADPQYANAGGIEGRRIQAREQGTERQPRHRSLQHPRQYTVRSDRCRLVLWRDQRDAKSDEFGSRAVVNSVDVYGFNATLLHLLGLDHERLSCYQNGLERRLTNVHGHVAKDVLA